MSQSASRFEASSPIDAGLTPEGVAHWRAEVQAFFTEALAQLGNCIDAIESQVQAEGRRQPAPEIPSLTGKGEEDSGRDPWVSNRSSREGDDVQDRRLAELAQRLEAKLNESAPSKSTESDANSSFDDTH